MYASLGTPSITSIFKAIELLMAELVYIYDIFNSVDGDLRPFNCTKNIIFFLNASTLLQLFFYLPEPYKKLLNNVF